MKDAKIKVLIAGAGIGGLSAAIALARGGAQVEIYEASAQLSQVGAGLQLSANAMHVLSKLGLKKQIIAAGFAPQKAVIKDGRSGRALLTAPLGAAHQSRYGQPYIHIHRAALQDCLLQAAQEAGASLHLGHKITGYGCAQDGAYLSRATYEGVTSEIKGDIVIGADGIKSKICAQMNPDIAPEFTGQTAWRGLVPASALPDGLFETHSTVWTGPDRHIVVYYVKAPDNGQAMLNFVAVKEQESWQSEDWSQSADMDALRAAFEGWDSPIEQLLAACDESYLWGLFDRPPLPRWTHAHIALLGDSAHPMLPFMAQGAAMAIEDSYVLAQCLNADVSADLNIEASLKLYAQNRQARTAMLQAKSRNNAKLFHLGRGPARLWRDSKFKIGTHIPAARHSQFDPIYGLDVTQS